MYTMLFVIVFALVIFILVCMWNIYTKAGEPGWKAIIPLYSSYTMFKFTWECKYFWLMFISIVSCFISDIYTERSVIILFIFAIFCVVTFMLQVMLRHKLSVAFGHGVGFTIGLILFPIIFYPILALGSSEFQL